MSFNRYIFPEHRQPYHQRNALPNEAGIWLHEALGFSKACQDAVLPRLDTMSTLIEFLTENCCCGKPCSPVGSQSCKPVAGNCAI